MPYGQAEGQALCQRLAVALGLLDLRRELCVAGGQINLPLAHNVVGDSEVEDNNEHDRREKYKVHVSVAAKLKSASD